MTKPVGPYSPAKWAGDLLFISGQIGAVDGKLVTGGVTAEARQALANLKAVLESEGLGLANLAKVNVYLRHMSDFNALNEIYIESMQGHRPARAAIGVAELPLGALVEIEAVASRLTA